MHARMTSPASDLERAAVARLLSIGFTCPDRATVDELRALSAALAEGASSGDPIVGLVDALADEQAVSDMPYAFEALFGGQVPCPPYEASYEPDPFRGTRQMADAAGFYRAFGATANGPASERPDHVACQLEFLAFVAARRMAAEAAGDAEAQAVCAETEDEFLRQHVGRFMGAVCASMDEATDSRIYRALGHVGSGFIEAELAARGIEPAPVRRPGPSAVEGDEVVCGGAGCALTSLIGRSGPAAAGNGTPG